MEENKSCTKKCCSCKQNKELSEFYFTKDKKNNKIYYNSNCRKCHNINKRETRKHPYHRIYQNQKRRVRLIYSKLNHSRTKLFVEVFGIDVQGFALYMETKFKEGMTWDNYGKWEADHIIPLNSAKTVDEYDKLFYYKNIQPLWKEENMKKGVKIN